MLRFVSKCCLFCYRYCMEVLTHRDMDDADVVSDTDNTDTDTDVELDTILGVLMRSSGEMRLRRRQRYGRVYPNPSKNPSESDSHNFEKEDIAEETQRMSGVKPAHLKNKRTLADLILKREAGLEHGRGFSRTQKCRITNEKLPFHTTVVDKYDHKAFCGIHSPDGNYLLTACQDRFLRLYDIGKVKKPKLLKSIPGRDVGWSILDVAYSPDGRSIAYTSWSSNIHEVDLHGDCTVHEALPLCPEERHFCVFCLQFSSSGREILCGANDGHMYLYDRDNVSTIYRVEAHSDDVNAVAFADDTSQIIFSGGDDGFCKVWDRRTLRESRPRPVGTLAGHLNGIINIDSKGDSRYFISNSKDQSIKLWDIRMFSNHEAQENTKRMIRNNKWDYRWQEAPKTYTEGKQSLGGDTSVATYMGHAVLQTLIRCHFSPAFTTGQRYIYTGDAYGYLIIYDVLTGKVVSSLKGHVSCVRDVSWHPFRPEIITTSWDFAVLCWNHEARCQQTEQKDCECVEKVRGGVEQVHRTRRYVSRTCVLHR